MSSHGQYAGWERAQESPKIFGHALGHEHATGRTVGAAGIRRPTSVNRPSCPGPAVTHSPLVARRLWDLRLVLNARGRGPLGLGRRSPGAGADGHRSDQHRPPNRLGCFRPAVGSGVVDGSNPIGGEDFRSGGAGPAPSLGGLLVVQSHDGAHRHDHAWLRRNHDQGAVEHDRRLRRELPRHVARHRRLGGVGRSHRHLDQGSPAPTAI